MIIGITGTNGAGKGTVVEYLIKQKGFTHYSARDFISTEVQKRGLPLHRDNTRLVANDLRKTHGATYIIESLYNHAVAEHVDAVIESVREIAGAQFLKSHGALLWAVDADRKIRYERSVLRGTELDKISFDKFCEQEDREMTSTEKYDMNIFRVMKMADIVLTNNGTQEELFAQVEAALQKFQK